MERNRATLQQSPQWIGHWQGEVERVVHQAEHEMNTTPSTTDLASLALAAALGYLDFRLPRHAVARELPCPSRVV